MPHPLTSIWTALLARTATESDPCHALAVCLLYGALREKRGGEWMEHHRRMLGKAILRLEHGRQTCAPSR